MSMNLCCDEMDLWQTPSYITYMCYSEEDGGWEGIKRRYITWVKSHSNGVWRKEQYAEHDRVRADIKHHLEELDSYKTLNFFVM